MFKSQLELQLKTVSVHVCDKYYSTSEKLNDLVRNKKYVRELLLKSICDKYMCVSLYNLILILAYYQESSN